MLCLSCLFCLSEVHGEVKSSVNCTHSKVTWEGNLSKGLSGSALACGYPWEGLFSLY